MSGLLLFLAGCFCDCDYSNHQKQGAPTNAPTNAPTMTKVSVSSTRVYFFSSGIHAYLAEVEFNGHLYNLVEDKFMMHSPNCECLAQKPQPSTVVIPERKDAKAYVGGVSSSIPVQVKNDVDSFNDTCNEIKSDSLRTVRRFAFFAFNSFSKISLFL